MRAQWKCPYCGHTNLLGTFESSAFGKLYHCSVDDGGCDQPVVVKVVPRYDITTLRIEGCQDVPPEGPNAPA